MNATSAQPISVKALADAVLARNTGRNKCATSELRPPQLEACETPQKLRQLRPEVDPESQLLRRLSLACDGVCFPDGSPFTVQWFRAQLDDADIVGIFEDDGPVLMLACFAMSFASRPWDLRHPSSSAHPERESVRCGDCQHFVADSINPPGGIGNCAIAGEGSRGLLYPFKYHECGEFAERRLGISASQRSPC